MRGGLPSRRPPSSSSISSVPGLCWSLSPRHLFCAPFCEPDYKEGVLREKPPAPAAKAGAAAPSPILLFAFPQPGPPASRPFTGVPHFAHPSPPTHHRLSRRVQGALRAVFSALGLARLAALLADSWQVICGEIGAAAQRIHRACNAMQCDAMPRGPMAARSRPRPPGGWIAGPGYPGIFAWIDPRLSPPSR